MNWETYENRSVLAARFSKIFELRKWGKEIPFMQFPKDWEIKFIPPFGGAIIRFGVRRKGQKDWVSVYLDCYGMLGFEEQPYWEIYPYSEEESTYRVPFKNIKELLKRLKIAVKNLDKNEKTNN